MLRIKPYSKQDFTKSLVSILSNLNNFHSHEVEDRVNKTTLSGWKFQFNNFAVKGLGPDLDWTLIMLLMWFQYVGRLLSKSWRPIFLNPGLTVLKRLSINTFGVQDL